MRSPWPLVVVVLLTMFWSCYYYYYYYYSRLNHGYRLTDSSIEAVQGRGRESYTDPPMPSP